MDVKSWDWMCVLVAQLKFFLDCNSKVYLWPLLFQTLAPRESLLKWEFISLYWVVQSVM
jgi:hypothetical protein